MNRDFFCALFFAFACFIIGNSAPQNSDINVILMLVDGVRWDYLNKDNLEGFKTLASKGVKADYVNPIMPANSYPNWYTIVTGLYGEDHGFVQNYMYDEKHDDYFLMVPDKNASLPHWWNHAEPIWITAEKNGIKTAMYWWDGCQVEIKGRRPTNCTEYRRYWNWATVKEDTQNALSEILTNFQENKIRFALIYYEAVDANGHKYGPGSPECNEALRNISDILQNFQDELVQKQMEDKVSLVVVSDHGMTFTDTDHAKSINIAQHIDLKDIEVMLDGGSLSMLRPLKSEIDKVYNDLKKAEIPGLNIYKKEDIPERYHLKNSYLTQPILLVADKGYYIEKLDDTTKMKPKNSGRSIGSHGYDPKLLEDMRAIFLARGPGLKQGYKVESLSQVDHYNLVCRLLGMEPLENKGDKSKVEAMMGSATKQVVIPALVLTTGVLLSFLSF